MSKSIYRHLMIAAFIAAASPALAQENQTLKVAPADAAAIVHIDAKAAGEFLARLHTLQQKSATRPSTDPVAAKLPQAIKLAGKIDSIDTYLLTPDSSPLIVVYTKLTPRELLEEYAQLADLAGASIEETNGRYVLANKSTSQPAVSGAPAIAAMDAKTALGIDQSGVAIGIGNAMAEQLSQYRPGLGDDIKTLVDKVDTSAAIWGVFSRGQMKLPADTPALAWGNFYTDGGKESKLSFSFASAELAGSFSALMNKAAQRGDPIAKGLYKVMAQDRDVALTLNMDEAWGQKALMSLLRARVLAQRAASASALRAIGSGIMMYKETSGSSRTPASLDELVKAGMIMPKSLQALGAENGDGVKSKYVFIVLPAKSDAKLVNAYEPPDINNGEGGNVLFADSSVKWLPADELNAAVAKTKEALDQGQ